MIEEIINKYEEFSDSLISEFTYRKNDNSKDIQIVIKCMNKLNDYEFETILICFGDVVSFQFIEKENQSSVVINSALINCASGIITVDFFPSIIGRSNLVENENSDFKIKCKKIDYSVL